MIANIHDRILIFWVNQWAADVAEVATKIAGYVTTQLGAYELAR
jgi:hypothetical protein